MLCVTTTGGGKCLGVPDVCLTPPLATPVPYPNSASCSDGSGARCVYVESAAVLRVGDRIARSTGDEAGNMPGGVVSARFAGAVEFVSTLQAFVRVEGKLVATHGSVTGHNLGGAPNGVGANASPSQKKVRLAPGGGGGGGRRRKSPLADLEELLPCSPTLRAQIEQIRDRGDSIEYGRADGGAYRFGPVIIVDRGLKSDLPRMMNAIAHEVGHALFEQGGTIHRPGMTEAEFVEENTMTKLISEGEAVYNECLARSELRANCPGRDIPVSDEKCWGIFQSDRTRDEKILAMAQRMAGKHPGGSPPGTTYLDFYTQFARDRWRAIHHK